MRTGTTPLKTAQYSTASKNRIAVPGTSSVNPAGFRRRITSSQTRNTAHLAKESNPKATPRGRHANDKWLYLAKIHMEHEEMIWKRVRRV